MVKNAGKIENGGDDMKKIDYALENIPECWELMNVRELIDYSLCPSDFGLEDIISCGFICMYYDDIICERCWNEEIEVMI